MKNKLLLSLLLISSLILGACSFRQAQESQPVSAPAHWTYEGEEGPQHWGEIDPTYATCGTGTKQSPINITAPNEKDLTNIVFHYQPSEVNILNNGHTVQVNYDAGSYIELDSVRYDVAQFHYHAPVNIPSMENRLRLKSTLFIRTQMVNWLLLAFC